SLTYGGARAPISFPKVTLSDDEDDNPPRMERFLPDNIPMFADEVVIELTFSEPLDTTLFTPETFLLWLQPDAPVEVTPSWRDPLRLLLTPDTLEPGARYRLEITEFELADLSGNRVGDSLRQHVFTVIDADSLGSISGEAMIEIAGKENDSVMLSFSKVGEQRTFDMAASSGTFRIDLPAGKYLLSGFVDSDGDGEKGNGSVEPYALAETMAEYPDTIAVRARFETAGIQFEIR
ncbi:MAG: Ig-like domain-containing protein, partial [candidate division Zixibacteria bacterium]|nr:Ig-like domain-containing protein [candidate division Zixibacteria bacterium]